MRQWEYAFSSGVVHAQDPSFFDDFTPRRGNWHTWDVRHLNSAQCRIAAKHAAEDICWEKMKTAVVITTGVVFTTVVAASLLFWAGAVVYLTGSFFAALLEISAGITALEIGIWSVIVLVGTAAAAYGAAGLAFVVTIIWTKEFLPAINRSASYRDHLHTSIDTLMKKAENRV